MNIYKKALKLMVTASEEIDLEELNEVLQSLPKDTSIDIPEDLPEDETQELKEAIDILMPQATTNAPTPISSNTDLTESPKRKRQTISKKIINELYNLLYKKLTPKQKEELKRQQEASALSGPKEDPDTVIDKAVEALSKNIENTTDVRVPTTPSERINILKEIGNTSNRKRIKEIADPTQEDANEMVESIKESTMQLLNLWRENHGLPALEMPISNEEIPTSFSKDTTATESISNYLKYFAKSKNINIASEVLINPLLFYSILKSINEEKGYKFAEYIYRLAFSEGKKIGTRAIIAKEFCGWVLNELKMVLETISKPVNEYMEANNIVEEKLSENRILYLLQRGGGYVEKLINASFSKEYLDLFSQKIEGKLEDDIKASKNQLAVDKFFSTLSNAKKLEIVLLTMTNSKDIFPAKTKEAYTLKQLYHSVTNLQPTLTRETGKQTRPATYEESLNLLQNQELEVGKTKDIIEERGLSGVEFKSDSLDEEEQKLEQFKIYPEPNGIFTIVTNFPDLYAKRSIKETIENLKRAYNRLYQPESLNVWEEIIIEIGKKIVGARKAEEKIKELEESGKQTSEAYRRIYTLRIEKEYKNKPFENIPIFDKNGNEIELSPEDKEKNRFPIEVITAAEEYLSREDLYNLACSFKILDNNDVEKLRDPYRALKYGVKEPFLLTPYHQNIVTAFKNQSYSLYKKAVFEMLN